MVALKASARNDLVFGTSRGHVQNPSNLRNRVLAPAVKLANERLEEAGETPLPKISPHKLRHTAIWLWFVVGYKTAAG